MYTDERENSTGQGFLFSFQRKSIWLSYELLKSNI